MRAEDFGRVEALFDAVVHLPPSERSAALAAQGSDAAERAEVEALLEAHDRLAAAAGPIDDGPLPQLGPGAFIGSYRLIDRIGAGGMGEVYRAERADGAFDRHVAIKVTRAALAGPDALDRFRRERQILATLDHPRIVTLLDGGVTPQGLAYFVMEHVEGVPLTDYCEQRNPSLDERLQLIRRVCEAVDHAHQHAVVHRDLKPANVLVTADGFPKVLDFGVAKLVDEQVTADHTAGVLPAPLTPNYASPEQIRGLPVTTASDVYSLGVLLYEAVSGTRPYDTGGRTLDRVLQIVVDTEPDRPSRAMGTRTLGQPAYGSRQLRGDIDAIVMKALRKDPEERYASPRDMAEDLARVSRRRPVTARPPSAGYVARRFVARNRTLVAGAVLAMAGIVVALGIALWQWQVAREEQAGAERRFAEVRQLANKVLFDYQEALRVYRGPSDVRARMAADSLAYLDALSAERSDDELLLEVARGYMAVADVQGNTRAGSIGDVEGAMKSLDHAERALDDLLSRRPGLPRAQELHAELGCVSSRIDVVRAAAHARRCVDALTPLVAGRDAADPLDLRLGEAHLLLLETGDMSQAAAVAKVFEPLVDRPQAGLRRRSRQALALMHRLVGLDALDRGESARALAEGRAALQSVMPLVTTPDVLPMERAFSLQLMGRAALALGDEPGGRASLEEAVRLARVALEQNPGDAFIQDRVVLAYAELVAGLLTLDRAAAMRRASEAVALLPRLTLTLPSPGRDLARGLLLATDARANPALLPCARLAAAQAHLDAAAGRRALAGPYAEASAWVRRRIAACDGDAGAGPQPRD